jgi:hypothetical protein
MWYAASSGTYVNDQGHTLQVAQMSQTAFAVKLDQNVLGGVQYPDVPTATAVLNKILKIEGVLDVNDL